jgi:hypothetical protein
LRVEVFATHHDMEVLEFMETMDLQVTRRKGSLQTRGPIGDIVIVSRPARGAPDGRGRRDVRPQKATRPRP